MESHDSEYAEYAEQNAKEYAETNKVTAATIRMWLRTQGIPVAEYGAIPRELVNKYHAYHNTYDLSVTENTDDDEPTPAWQAFTNEAPEPKDHPSGMRLVWRRQTIAYLEIVSLALGEAQIRVNQITPSYMVSDAPLGNEEMQEALSEVFKLIDVSTDHLEMVSKRVDQAIENNAKLTDGLSRLLNAVLTAKLDMAEFGETDINSPYPSGLMPGEPHNCGDDDCPVTGYTNDLDGEMAYARDVRDGVKPLPEGAALDFDESGEPRLMFAGQVPEGDKSFEFRPPTSDYGDRFEPETDRFPF